jgi:hypothetical protein
VGVPFIFWDLCGCPIYLPFSFISFISFIFGIYVGVPFISQFISHFISPLIPFTCSTTTGRGVSPPRRNSLCGCVNNGDLRPGFRPSRRHPVPGTAVPAINAISTAPAIRADHPTVAYIGCRAGRAPPVAASPMVDTIAVMPVTKSPIAVVISIPGVSAH